jgi:hypothetical protein
MNLFRSEEHIRNWARYDPATKEGIFTLEELVKLFTGDLFWAGLPGRRQGAPGSAKSYCFRRFTPSNNGVQRTALRTDADRHALFPSEIIIPDAVQTQCFVVYSSKSG